MRTFSPVACRATLFQKEVLVPGRKIVLRIILCLFALPVGAQEKFALVIGNSNYTNFDKLNNPTNDAADMKRVLEGLGFNVVHLSDTNLNKMRTEVLELKKKLSVTRYSYGFFFFAGHGVQSKGENYLIPVDANIHNEDTLPRLTLPVQYIISELENAGNELNVMVMDTCRDIPAAFRQSPTRGLEVVTRQPAGSIIVYATKSGKTALDGSGRNGLFTSQLLRHIVTPGIEVKELFNRTGADVISVSNNNQIPTVYNHFYGTAYLGSRPVTPGPPPFPPEPPPPPMPQPEPLPVSSNLAAINGGNFVMGSPAHESGRSGHEGPQRRISISPFYIGKHPVTVGEFRRFVEETWYKTEAELDDGGYIWSGSLWLNKEDANWKNAYFNQDDNHPVVLVSWYDAVWYCNWLSVQEELQPVYTVNGKNVFLNRTASGYRLPTEAEWEYACRAGTTTPFNTGNTITSDQANFNGNAPRQKTTPVGSFTPNSWGLYDMHGNVDEWCWDWAGRYVESTQTDPAGPNFGVDRVVRGGGWYDNGQELRSASRGNIFPSGRNNRLGFRVVRNFIDKKQGQK